MRYFEDGNFTGRVMHPPVLHGGHYPDRPDTRADQWTNASATPDKRLDPAINAPDALVLAEEGGLRREPELAEAGLVLEPAPEPDDMAVLDDAPTEADVRMRQDRDRDDLDASKDTARDRDQARQFATVRRATVLNPDDGIFPNL